VLFEGVVAMNGFGLLIAVAALGVDVGWETGPGGQSYYTIHIEKLLLEPLRDGQAIVSNVDPLDRNLSRFQLIVGDHAHAISSEAGPSGSDVVQHGWKPGANGGTDYLIQISPERLESLAKGSLIIGQIDPQVTDVRKLYVFSGVQQLPRRLGPSTALPLPPKFLGAEGGLRTASAESADGSVIPAPLNSRQSKDGAASGAAVTGPQFGGPQFNRRQPATIGRTGDFPALPPLTSAQPRQDDWRTNAQPGTARPNAAAAAPSVGEPRYGVNDRTRIGTQLPATQQANFGRDASPAMSPVRAGYGQPNPAYDPASPAYGAATAAFPPNFEQIIADAKALGAAEAKIAAASQTPALPAVVTPAAETPPVKESGLPLILTTLMLFTSLATNLFLGWLAWSYFWRFRDAVGDATRAQSTLLSTRQAA
jgi:hypothetical protein